MQTLITSSTTTELLSDPTTNNFKWEGEYYVGQWTHTELFPGFQNITRASVVMTGFRFINIWTTSSGTDGYFNNDYTLHKYGLMGLESVANINEESNGVNVRGRVHIRPNLDNDNYRPIAGGWDADRNLKLLFKVIALGDPV